MTVKINWNELADYTDGGQKIAWDVPHEIYRSTSSINRNSPGTPIAVLPPFESIYYDDGVGFDTVYYYRIGEVRPAGRFISPQEIRIEARRLILKIEALFWAEELFGTGRTDENGNLEPLEEFVGEVPDDWFWTGTGQIGEWLQYWVNGTMIINRFRGESTSQQLGNIIIENDYRNYPGGMVDYLVPFTDGYFYQDGELINTPSWWGEYWSTVDPANYPSSWHAYWSAKTGDADVNDWYSKVWTL